MADRIFSMAYLTAPSFAPPDMIVAASELGYGAVGLRLMPAMPGGAAQTLIGDPKMLRETRARIEGTGVRVFDVEIIRITAGFRLHAFLPLMEAGYALGAKAILVAGDDPEEERLLDHYAQLCLAAAGYGLTCDLEFMPWTAVKTASDAARIVGGAAQPNARVLVDALHFARSGSTIEQIRALPRQWLSYAQICDAPRIQSPTHEQLLHTARSERLLPGEGDIRLAALFAALPRDLPISVEIPSESRVARLGETEYARQALAASRAAVEQL
ncbi:MAG: sugar phosphate isomerase/epimerase [Acetobacteraceae bacterium]|nr:sugar phosphate isomerase/epimerase [Acetobacteraceae bacterium]